MISSWAESIPLIFEPTRVSMEAAASEGAASGRTLTQLRIDGN